MNKVRARGEDIRKFILEHVEKHPSDISKVTGEHFGITRQAVNKHLQRLQGETAIAVAGKTRSRLYTLAPAEEWSKVYKISKDLAEDVVWRTDIAPIIGKMPDNIAGIWHYGFTEMFNNAIDHSGGTAIYVLIKKTAANTEMYVVDNGVGIFKKIQKQMDLLDERHAVLELSKGKLTTDPARHTGEGIFFTSRMFDNFSIMSGGVYFSHTFGENEDWVLEQNFESRTAVYMNLHNHTSRTTTKVFNQFASGDEYGFNKTVVPVRLAQYGNDQLISRSQAKRLLARIELFKVVVFDFNGVEAIGQAFTDEIFRVFARKHPEIDVAAIKTNSAVKRMIERAKAGDADDSKTQPTLL
ncbi:MAG: STAS-like domain-containing protein [Gammaproteobacteria bacterium]